MKLHELAKNKEAIIQSCQHEFHMRQRLQDLGFVNGNSVSCVQTSVKNDPRMYWINATLIALRNEDAKYIEVKEVDQ